jgi:2-polyprenyl-6-methoxyphenol hydroxylase-like FAD-dependent oxidoreductase
MNTGFQDGYALGRALATERLDDYDAQRRPVAEKVVAFADRMTRIATTHHPLLRGARNIALPALGRLPAFRTRLATELAELNYR